MTAGQILSLVVVAIAIPAAGVTLYVCLCIRMHRRSVPEPPYITYFFLFAHGGICFLLLLTALLWGWSGMSSLGTFYLLFISPFPAGVFAFALHDSRTDSTYHCSAYWLCIAYICGIGFFLAWFIYCSVARC